MPTCTRRTFLRQASVLAAGLPVFPLIPPIAMTAPAATSTVPPSVETTALRAAAAGLMLDWARLLAPHFGPGGSMDLDLRDWPGAQGPSYYNQFSHYGLLLLAQGIVPGVPAAERAHFRDLALSNLAYGVGLADAEFHTPHYSRGRDWGRHVGEWLCYYQLCALELMEREAIGDAALRTRLRTVVAGAVDHLHRQFVAKYAVTPTEFVGNHDTWHALLFYRAGRHFDRADWRDYARDFMRRCVLPFQHADGYWPEAQGIVVGYSLVTAQAVSAYAELADDTVARAAVGRALGFHDYFILPDGSAAVVVDIRMRHHAQPFVFMPPGFADHARGRQVALNEIGALRVYLAKNGVHDNGAQAFAFFSTFAEQLFASGPARPALECPAPATLPAARLERGDWIGLVGWQLVPEWGANRFVLDSQNFLELWHARAGYLAGTGNSKFMPRFSTVRRTSHGRAYVPERARGERRGPHAAVAQFGFGPDETEVRLTLTETGCEIGARLARHESGAAYEFAVLLALKPGDTVRIGDRVETIEPLHLVQGRERFVWRGLTWTLPAGAVLEYPVVPHNSYTQHGLPAAEDYVGRITLPLTAAEQVITIG